MSHVLIGFAEALPAPEVLFSLRAAGHTVSAFGRSDNAQIGRLPLHSYHCIPAPETSANEAISSIERLARTVDLILPMDDTGLWLVNAAKVDPARIAGATGGAAEIGLDKVRQTQAAKRAGLAVLPFEVFGPGEQLAKPVHDPAIARPAKAVTVADGKISKGKTHFLAAGATELPMSDGKTPMLVQALVSGVGEGVFGFATHKGVVAWSGHRRVRMMNPHGSGSSACRRMIPEPELVASVERFVKSIGWQGAFMVELLRDAEGTPWFVELNGRMWGSLPLARRQGLEYPAWAVAQALNPEFSPVLSGSMPDPGIMRHLGRDVMHLAFVLRGPNSAFHRRTWPSFWQSALGVLRPAKRSAFYNYDPSHPGYFLRDALATVKKGLFR